MRKPSTFKAKPQSKPDTSEAQKTRNRTSLKRTPDLELAFGARIRAARISAGLSQGELGAAVGISFQQVQKYEKGADRIAASTLQGFAAALGVHPGSFFDDSPMPAGDIPDVKAALKAAKTVQQIRNSRVRRHLLSLAEVLAEEVPGEAGEAETAYSLKGRDGPH